MIGKRRRGDRGKVVLVEVLLDTPVHVHYGFLSLGRADKYHEGADDACRGQVNGLCGASVPGLLFMTTGLHTGDVRVRIELHTDEPELEARWQDVVEVVHTTWADDLALAGFDSSAGPVDLPPGVYQARYCVVNFQLGRDLDTANRVESPDEYLLQFWPATGADRIVRQGGEAAAYWHVKGPKPTWTFDELTARVADMRQSRADREAEEGEGRWEQDYRPIRELAPATRTGDDQDPAVMPSDDIGIPTTESGMAMLWAVDPALFTGLADAGDGIRRAVTVWALDQVLAATNQLDQAGVAQALTAIRTGTPLHSRQLDQAIQAVQTLSDDDSWADVRLKALGILRDAAAGGDTLATVCTVLVSVFSNSDDALDLTRVRTAFPDLALL